MEMKVGTTFPHALQTACIFILSNDKTEEIIFQQVLTVKSCLLKLGRLAN